MIVTWHPVMVIRFIIIFKIFYLERTLFFFELKKEKEEDEAERVKTVCIILYIMRMPANRTFEI